MGWVKKQTKKVTKAAKKVVKSVTKVVKTIAKPITKVVKKVAKTIKSVGSKVWSGIKSTVKSIGSSLSKLGPLASIALMAIPGFQAFGASLASGMGFSSALATKMATGALTGFITSGGSLKGALAGGVMAGAGSYLGDVAKGAWDSGSLATGFADANAAAMADNAFTGGLTGSAGFQAGMDSAATEWTNFTTKVGDFFSGDTGDIAGNTRDFVNTYDQYGMSPQEYMDTYGKIPDTISQNTAYDTVFEQNKEFVDFPEGTPDAMKEDYFTSLKAQGLDPLGETAETLKSDYFTVTDTGAFDPEMSLSIDEYGQYDPTTFYDTAQSGAAGTPTYIADTPYKMSDKVKDYLQKSLLSGTGSLGTGATPQFVTSVSPIDMTATGASKTGGTGGLLGFTDVQRETQAQLIAQAEAQAERARQQAAKGWSVA